MKRPHQLTSLKCPLKYVKAVPYGFIVDIQYITKPWPVDAWREWYQLERSKGVKP